ncbi:hypothetical protein BDB01DRAFT_798427 [Pilobolus umbonatus]|nr:hypothetical protein BDB01DRAFT_798427 [Pilobolus umbonatus]
MSQNTSNSRLDLSDSGSFLPSNLFQPKPSIFNRKKKSANIQQLFLRRNGLISLKPYGKTLYQFKDTLTELSLRENHFVEIPGEISCLINLTSLSLASNRITHIDQPLLSKLKHLQWLNLSGNQLVDMPEDIGQCKDLCGIDLDNNRFGHFPVVLFLIPAIEIILMQRNSIKTMSDHHYFPDSLTTLNLSFNQLNHIPACLIVRPPYAITHLHLSGNKLRQLPDNFLSVGYTKLVSLDLHTCQLECVQPSIFIQLSKCRDLRRLNLAINRLGSIPAEIGLVKHLQWLNLNDNLLTSLPETLSELTHLVKLGLVQNRFEMLPPFMFMHMFELQKLDIRRNQLKYFPPSILSLSPKHEIHTSIEASVPHTVFPTLSNPATCPMDDTHKINKNCIDDHPYGGSLRTFMYCENNRLEYVDGILCDLGYNINNPESVQILSLSDVYKILNNTSSSNQRSQLRSALFPLTRGLEAKSVLQCNSPLFKRNDNPTLGNRPPSPVVRVDPPVEEEGSQQSMDTETQRLMTDVPPLKEVSIRNHLTSLNQTILKETGYQVVNTRLDQNHKKFRQFLTIAFPDDVVPDEILSAGLNDARQCDMCQIWYTESPLQIGYLTKICNNRFEVPIRFNICSIDCSVNCLIKLHQSTTEWQSRQTLAHIDPLVSAATPITIRARPVNRRTEPSSTSEGAAEDYHPHNGFTSIHDISSDSCGSIETDHVSWGYFGEGKLPPLSKIIKTRMKKFATTLYIYQDTHNKENEGEVASAVIPATRHITSPTRPRRSYALPLLTLTTRTEDGRIFTESIEPRLRLTDPTSNPIGFHHLPRDAIRLERF